MSRRIVLAGGSGFIGTFLQERLAADGYEVVVLTRFPHDPEGGVRQRRWDGKHSATGQKNSKVPVRSLTSPGDQLTAATTNATAATF